MGGTGGLWCFFSDCWELGLCFEFFELFRVVFDSLVSIAGVAIVDILPGIHLLGCDSGVFILHDCIGLSTFIFIVSPLFPIVFLSFSTLSSPLPLTISALITSTSHHLPPIRIP